MPLSCLNSSPATRLDELPLPKLSLPGSFFALARMSATDLVRRVGAHDEHLAALAEAGDRDEVLDRVVGQLLVEVLVGGVRRVGRDQHGVAVGRGARRRLRRHHPARAGLVVDDDRLLGVGGDRRAERARQLVGGAAGSERHDEGDRMVGILGLGEYRGRGERCEQGCERSEGRQQRRARGAEADGERGHASLQGSGGKESVVAAGEVLDERLRNGDVEVEQQEGQRLAVAVEVERVVDAAVEHVVEDEVHRLQVRQQVARHPARSPVRELRGDTRFAHLLDQDRPERRMPGDRR